MADMLSWQDSTKHHYRFRLFVVPDDSVFDDAEASSFLDFGLETRATKLELLRSRYARW